jgi:RNA polymerase sigma-B factor
MSEFPRTHVDEVTALRTIPRVVSAGDQDGRPAVDQRLWLDHVRYARTGEPHLLSRLVLEYRTYALSIARRLHRGRDASEDVDQVALEALVVALQRFDPERGIPFPAFATPTILGSVRRHYRDHGWLLRVPRRVHELASAEQITVDRLVTRLGRLPSASELASELRIDLDDLLQAQDAVHARRTMSIDAADDAADAVGRERLGEIDHRLDHVENRMALAAATLTLDEPSQELLQRYFYEGWSQARIADHVGVSQMQVSRMLAAVLARLRRHLDPA